MKKFVRLTAFMISALSLAFIVSCGDDDEPAGPGVEGSYQFTSATAATDGPFSADGTVFTDQNGDPIIASGSSVLELVVGLVLGGAVDGNGDPLCSNSADTRITLEAPDVLLYTCSGGTERVENGDWDLLDSGTDLTLGIIFDGIGRIPVTITNLEIGENQISGLIENLPAPGDTFGLSEQLVFIAMDVVLARD